MVVIGDHSFSGVGCEQDHRVITSLLVWIVSMLMGYRAFACVGVGVVAWWPLIFWCGLWEWACYGQFVAGGKSECYHVVITPLLVGDIGGRLAVTLLRV